MLHGSGSDIDKFSTEYIGTGEGTQANGWGLYFAQQLGVAKNYRDKDFKKIQAFYGKKGKNRFEFEQPLFAGADSYRDTVRTFLDYEQKPELFNSTQEDDNFTYALDENAEMLANEAQENGLNVNAKTAKLIIRAGLSKAILEEDPNFSSKELKERLEEEVGRANVLLVSKGEKYKDRTNEEIEELFKKRKQKIKDALELYDNVEFNKFGKIYKASVDASLEDDILDWEKPLYEQSDALLNKILSQEDKIDLRRLRQLEKEKEDVGVEYAKKSDRRARIFKPEEDTEELKESLSKDIEAMNRLDRKIKKIKKDNPVISGKGTSFYYDLSRSFEQEYRNMLDKGEISQEEFNVVDKKFADGVSSYYDKFASQELASKGILGHSYFDADTNVRRIAQKRESIPYEPETETRNFVFYVDDIVTIEDKFRKKGKKAGSEEAKQAARTKLGEKAFRERYPDIKETVFTDDEGITRRASNITAPTIKMSPSRGAVFVRQTPAETKFWREVETNQADTEDLLDFVPEASIIDGVFAMPPTQDNILNLREYFRDLEAGKAERTPPRFSTAKNTYLDQFYDAANLSSIQPTEVADDSDQVTSFVPLADLDTANVQSLEPLFRDKFSRKDFTIPIQVTSLDLMPTPQEVEKMRNGTFVPEKIRTLVQAAQFLQDRWEAATGRTTPYEYTSENIDLLSQIFFEQAIFALERDGNAIGWYDSKLKAAKRIMRLVDPRIMRTRDSEALFDFVLSVTSNGQAVIDNFGIATDIFRFHAKKGRFPETVEEFQKGGERNDAMLQAFKFHNAWQKSGQNQSIVDFLSDDYTVNELKEFARKFNEQLGYEAMKVPGAEGVNVAVKGSYVLGPKIGQGFYQNLRGNYDSLTTDIWWMRLWNRAIGRPFKNALNSKERNERRKEIKQLMLF